MWNFLIGGCCRVDCSVVRWRPGLPRHERALEVCRGDGSDLLRGRRSLHIRLHEGGCGALPRLRHVEDQEHRINGLVPLTGGVRVGVRQGGGRPAARVVQRRHGPLHGFRGLVRPAARSRGRDTVPLPGREGRGIRRRGATRGGRGGRAGHHPPDAVHAHLLLERRRGAPVPRELLRPVPGRVEARRLGQGHGARDVRHIRAVPTRR